MVRREEKGKDPLDEIGDMAVGSRLLATSQDVERRSPASVPDVGRNQPAVPRHAFSIGVKDPRNDGIDSPLDVVRHG